MVLTRKHPSFEFHSAVVFQVYLVYNNNNYYYHYYYYYYYYMQLGFHAVAVNNLDVYNL
jgi:hypothetical protein